MCTCDYVKNRIGSWKKCVFWFEKGYKRISVLDNPKNTAVEAQLGPSNI